MKHKIEDNPEFTPEEIRACLEELSSTRIGLMVIDYIANSSYGRASPIAELSKCISEEVDDIWWRNRH